MGLLTDWLFGDNQTSIKSYSDPYKEQIQAALLPMIQKLAAAGTGTTQPNQMIANYNQGINPWSGQAMNTGTARQSVAYPTRNNIINAVKNRLGTNPGRSSMNPTVLAMINKARLSKGLNPISMG